MKNLKLFIALALCLGKINAQEIAKVKILVDSIVLHYNQQQYKSYYNLLNEDFKKKAPENEFTIMFRDMVYKGFGKITKYQYLNNKESAENYLMYMENGKLKLTLNADANNKIAGMVWLPYTEEVVSNLKKKENYLGDNKKLSALDLKVDSVVKDYMTSANTCGLSVGIYENGNYHYYNYGETKRNNKTLATNQTYYEIGSITKTFTGILLAQAVIDKKLSLKDDIRKYLPEKYPNLNYTGYPILIEHLANHTSCIPSVPEDIEKQENYNALNPYKNYNKKMIFDFLKKVVPDTLPGTKNRYSNTGMALLGLILEKVYTKTYNQLVYDYITLPNELISTKVNMSKEDLSYKCTGYNESGIETPNWELNDFAAAGGINSNSKELLDYFVINMQEKTEELRLSHDLTWGDVNYGVGLGWHIVKTKKGNKMYWHNGGTYGFSSFGAFIKEKNCAIVILANSGVKVDPMALSLLKYLQQ